MKRLLIIITLLAAMQCASARTYGLFVGLGSYDYELNPLISCRIDATTMAECYESLAPDGEYITLLDDRATVDIVKTTMKRLFSKSTAADDIVIFISTHGNALFLSMYDSNLYKEDLQDIISECTALNKVIIINACYSGTFNQHRYSTERDGARSYARLKKKASGRSKNVIVFSSTSSSKLSYGYSSYPSSSLFVSALSSGLNGSADSNGDSVVSIRELYDYVRGSSCSLMQTPQMRGRFDPSAPFVSAK